MKKILYSFPVQLVVEHLKVNQMPLLCWALVVFVVSKGFGEVLGIPYLFLDPEYLNEVSFFSFLIVGMSLGLMTVAFHITSYILLGSKYSFVGILSYPFTKFSLNNSIIPFLVIGYYIGAVFFFQINNEFTSLPKTILMVMALPFGAILSIVIFFRYFQITNKDIFKFLAGSVDKRLKRSAANRANALGKLNRIKKKSYHVDHYFDLKFRLKSTEGLHDFYDKESVLKVFDQNHLNSFLIEVLILAFIIISGFFVDVKYFQIPAAATGILLLSLAIMLLGAVSYWFRGWVVTTLIGLFLALNFLVKSEVLKSEFEAIGLDYHAGRKEYSLKSIQETMTPEAVREDKDLTLSILENWKTKQNVDKPKMVFLCVSGGGLRSALWTTNVLQELSQRTQGQFMEKVSLITGASGGMIGASYYRELFLHAKQDDPVDLDGEEVLQNISRDNLNPILFSLFVNDLFIRFHKFEFEGRSYLKDRGHAFERQLILNSEGMLGKKLIDYRRPERLGQIPMLILGPTIANDGRKIYLSANPVAYMTMQSPDKTSDQFLIDGVDFQRFFKEQAAEDLKFMSALRMNASFPYITPNITLPSNPGMVVMDAGVADNFGISDALRFINTFSEWLEENTSGVVILSVRDTKKFSEIEAREGISILDKFSSPISSVYNNLANLQDISNDYKLRRLKEDFKGQVDYVSIEYDKSALIKDSGKTYKAESASLSWHLTTKEKRSLVKNIETDKNQSEIKRLIHLIQE